MRVAEAFKPKSDHEEDSDEKVRLKSADILHLKPNPMWTKHANFMAETAGITISDETIKTYSRLRDEKPDPEKRENHSGMSDQEILAEALRISGDMSSFAVFTKKYPHIFKKKP